MTIAYEQKDTILHVENLSIAYRDKVIISGISFSERDTIRKDKIQGQTIAFVGRSGRGKSTLFRALAGLQTPTTGTVLIPDFSLPVTNGKQPAKKVQEGDVGFVNQKYTLFRHKTIYQALMFALRNSPLPDHEKKEKIMHYLSGWGLLQCRDQFPNELSGGQRQRTAILEQLLNSNYYMVLDEPFSGLDVGNIANVKESFKLVNMSHELNTIIFSTHDIALAVELADSLYVIGYPENDEDRLKNTATILKHFDLKQMGLAWQEALTDKHLALTKEIESMLLNT